MLLKIILNVYVFLINLIIVIMLMEYYAIVDSCNNKYYLRIEDKVNRFGKENIINLLKNNKQMIKNDKICFEILDDLVVTNCEKGKMKFDFSNIILKE